MKLFGKLPLFDLIKLAELSEKIDFETKDANIIIIGANGFIGKWLSTYFSYMMNQGLHSGTLTLVTRDLISQEILLTDFPSRNIVNVSSKKISKESFTHLLDARSIVIFAATSTSASGVLLAASKNEGVELANKVMSHLPTKDNLLVHLSSGGVYEPSARTLNQIPKDYPTQKNSNDLYIQEKILIEDWSQDQEAQGNFVARNPRLFAFYGPGLPLDRHFVVSEFIGRARQNKSLLITGNTRNLRTYLHPVDLVLQILGQCLNAKPTYSQIGSCKPITILDLAKIFGDLFGIKVSTEVNLSPELNNYVPSDFPKIEHISLVQGIEQWNEWLDFRSI